MKRKLQIIILRVTICNKYDYLIFPAICLLFVCSMGLNIVRKKSRQYDPPSIRCYSTFDIQHCSLRLCPFQSHRSQTTVCCDGNIDTHRRWFRSPVEISGMIRITALIAAALMLAVYPLGRAPPARRQ